jgi:general stress protein YciG
MAGKAERGFASMDPNKQREIASKGGHAAHERGTAHEFTADEAREAGRKGGQTVSRNREHMAEIGRKGGDAVSRDRQHMADIGRVGGERRRGTGEPGDTR